MSFPATRNLLDHVWSYSLMEALYARRTRRFGMGFEMTEGPFRYKSTQAPVSLSEHSGPVELSDMALLAGFYGRASRHVLAMDAAVD